MLELTFGGALGLVFGGGREVGPGCFWVTEGRLSRLADDGATR